MADFYFLSGEDRQLLGELLKREKQSRVNTQNRPAVEEILDKAPDVYIARSPPLGIPALTEHDTSTTGTGTIESGEDQPGSAICKIYKIQNISGIDKLVYIGRNYLVYNISTSVIPGWRWIKVGKDKFGNWIVDNENFPFDQCTEDRTVTIQVDTCMDGCDLTKVFRDFTWTNGCLTIGDPYREPVAQCPPTFCGVVPPSVIYITFTSSNCTCVDGLSYRLVYGKEPVSGLFSGWFAGVAPSAPGCVNPTGGVQLTYSVFTPGFIRILLVNWFLKYVSFSCDNSIDPSGSAQSAITVDVQINPLEITIGNVALLASASGGPCVGASTCTITITE